MNRFIGPDYVYLMSPFFTSLMSENLQFAKTIFEINFLTYSDLYRLPYHVGFQRGVALRNRPNSGPVMEFLRKMATSPPSLFQISVVNVSTVIGGIDRKAKIEKLEIPNS